MASKDKGSDLLKGLELKHMVMSFRVSELQMLLGMAGRNKSGRKHDLMSRALILLKNGCNSQIQEKIKELYHRRFPRSKAFQYMANSHGRDDDDDHGKKRDQTNGVAGIRPNKPAVHPNVRFKPLPFYKLISDVVKPSSLISKANKSYNEVDLSFTLSEEQVRDICNSSTKDDWRKFSSGYKVQVQLRFCLLETTCEQNDALPSNLCVKVNHKVAQLPPCIPPSKAGVEPKRANRSIDITSLCRLCHVSFNRIEITWSAEFGRNYATCINVVQQQTAEMLMQRLRRKGIRNAGHSVALVKEKLTRDPDSEIATTSLKVSLLCPLGKMRMKTPARPVTCTHLQCFDAMLFLQMNERKPTWICPVCDKSADFSNLFIDGLFMDILSETESEEILFFNNGQWKPVESSKETHVLSTPSKPIALDLSGSSPVSSPSINKAKEPVVIDLTGDSSEDEEVLPSSTKTKEREQEDIHSLSSTSPYRSESVGLVGEKQTPVKYTAKDLTWESAQEAQAIAHVAVSSLYGPPRTSARPSNYPLGETTRERSPRPNVHNPTNFSLPGSRDNTPPLHMGSLLNPSGIPGFPSHLDYGAQSQLDFNSLPYLLNSTYDPLRSSRSSPYSFSQTANHHYPPSTHSANDHVARSYLTSYPPPYHPYSPVPFTQTPDNTSAYDIIPID